MAAGIGVEVAMGVLSCWLAGFGPSIVYGQFWTYNTVCHRTYIQPLFAFGIKVVH